MQRPTARRATGASFFVTLFLLLSSAAVAQTTTTTHATDGHTPLEIAPGSPAGSYALGDFDQISLFSQSLSFRLPLLNVGGRGGAGYTVTLPIERKWRVKHTVYDPSGGDGQTVPEHHYLPIESWYTALKPGFSPGVMVVRQSGIDPSRVKTGCAGYYNKTLTRLTFVSPDGTEYELRDALFGGAPRPRGPSCGDGANRGRVFVTSDGSAATFVAESDVIDYTLQREDPEQIIIPVSGTLYLRDGTRYHVSGNVVDLIRDRNGNEVRFYLSAPAPDQPGLFVQKAVDSLGREVIFDNNEITYRGGGGAARTLRVLYAPLEERLRQQNDQHPAESVKSRGELFPALPVHPLDADFMGQPFDDSVVSEVVLPDGRKYGFRYNSYGELARVELPTGGAFEYDYQGGGLGNGVYTNGTDFEILRQVIAKRVYDEAGRLLSVTAFGACDSGAVSPPDSCVQVDQHDPAPGATHPLISRTLHYFHGVAGPGLFARPTYYTKWDEGREFRTESYAEDGVTLLRRVEQEWRQKGPVGWWAGYSPVSERGDEPANDPRMVETVTTLADSGQVSKTSSINPADGSVGFDQYNNPTDLWEYDYGAGTPLRHTKTAYLKTSTAAGVTYDYACDPATTCSYQSLGSNQNVIHLRGLPSQQSVYEVRAGLPEVERSRTRYEYDDYSTGNGHAALTARPDAFGLCLFRVNGNCQTLSSASYLTRGNVTATTGYLLADDGAVTGTINSYAQYDVAGNVVKAVDALGRETSFDFADNFGTPDGEARTNTAPAGLAGQSPQAHAYAFPKSVTDAAGYASYTQYDYNLGRPVDGEDINGAHTVLRYDDPLDRLKSGVRAFGSAEQSQTTVTYNDAARTITVASDLNAYNDNLLKSETVYDGFGRTVKTRKYEDAAQYVLSEQKYDAAGRGFQASNPYRPTLGESTVWTTTMYDALGRVTSVTTPDGAAVHTLYDGSRTLVTDQSKRQRISKADALGRLTDVWEVRSADTASGTEQVTFPVPQGVPVPAASDGYRTAYSYDVLGNLRTVTQGAQTRSFIYDSLSRLTSATNPEACRQGQAGCVPAPVTYNYDANGNLILKIDPRDKTGNTTLPNCPIPYTGGQVATCYEYDVLSRVKSRSYNDGTPDVTYTYDDPAVANSKGRLTSVASSVSTYSYGAYDALGKVKSSSQTTGGVTYSMPEYKYDLAGNLTSEKYPSGRVVETKYDTAGRVAGVRNAATGLYYAGATPTDSANRIQYTAAGAPSSVRLGNGLWEHTTFNTRLLPTHIGLGMSAADSSVLKLDYTYGETVGGAPDPTRNNGNVQSQTITVPGLATPLVQSYEYDALNRLRSAEEKGGATSTWKQVYAYDRYGNRSFASGTTSPDYSQTPNDPATGLPTDPSRNPVFNQTNNRIDVTAAGQGAYRYDAAGNLLCDTGHQCVQGPSSVTPYYSYDAEGRMKSAGGGYSGGGTSYAYDGDGRRVRKSTFNGEETVFVYDAAGRAVAEYSNQVEYKGTRYLTQDHLGSTRVITDARGSAHFDNGAGGSRHDYFPFGEEVGAGIGGRTTAQGYSQPDGVRQKFTSKGRDNETGLDYFLARYYSSAQGRFTSPDDFKGGPRELWVLGSGHPEKQALFYAEATNPQSLNKYQYCFNNPLRYIDPDGQKPQDSFENRMQQAIRDVNSGRITEAQYWERLRGAGVGAVAAVAAIFAVKAGVAGLTAAALWATRNPQAVEQVAQELVQTSSGNPTPANLGVPLTSVFNAEKNALTSGRLLFGSLKNAEVAAQFSKRGNTLVAGIVGVFNKTEGLSGSSIKSLINSVKDFARQEGMEQVEVQAIAVINTDLEKRLLQQGFQRTTVMVDGEQVNALTKTISVR